jgi:hypothetical protein
MYSFCHAEPAAKQSHTAPGPLAVVRRQPWRGVRRRRRGGPHYPIHHHSHHHTSMHVTFHAELAKPTETAPGPVTGSLARRQPWRGVRRRQRGGPHRPIQHHRHQPYRHATHVQFLHTLSARQNSRRQHLAPWRWCGGSPGEECDADSEAVSVILSNITGITRQAYSFCTRR